MGKITRDQFEKALKVVRDYRAQCEEEIDYIDNHVLFENKRKTKLIDLYFDGRVYSALYAYYQHHRNVFSWYSLTVEDLKELTEEKLYKIRGVGKKTVNQIGKIMMDAGLTLRRR